MRLRPARPADFAFVRSLTTDPANAPFIGDDDEIRLAAYLDDPSARLMIWGEAAGFALFREVGHLSGRVELFRLALARTGGGQGAAFLRDLIHHAFHDLGAARLWLDCSGENLRAQKTYGAAGFTLEGRLRQHWFRPVLGRSVDLLLYGLMRDEVAP